MPRPDSGVPLQGPPGAGLGPGEEPKDHLLMAAVLMAALRCVTLFFVAQRYFVRGIVMSGIKG